MTDQPRYATPFRGLRFRVGLPTKGGNWSLGISRSVWPRPLPHGMTLYAIHVLYWNLCIEVAR